MDENVFNTEMRKFLKQVGVTSQREIEESVRNALKSGKLKSMTLNATMTLKIEETGLIHEVKDTIKLE